MITLQYQYGDGVWIDISQWPNEQMAWISLGGDDYNYRTVNEDGEVLTDKSSKS